MKTPRLVHCLSLVALGACSWGSADGGGSVVEEPPGFPCTGGGSGFFIPELPPQPLIAAKAPPPISGGTLAVSPDGTHAVAADPDRDKVYVIDLTTETKQTVSLDPGSEPGRVAFDGASRAHVALRSKGAVVQIDLPSATLVRQTEVCSYPRGVAYHAASDSVLVACASGDLVRLAAEDHAERARAFLDLDLRDVVITKDEKIMVSRFRAAELLEVNTQNQVTRRLSPSPAKLDVATSTPDQTCGPTMLRTVTQTPVIAWRTTLDADGNVVMLHQRSRVEEVQTSSPGGYSGDGCSNVTETTVSKILGDQTKAGLSLPAAPMAVDIATTADNRYVALASAGTALLKVRGGIQLYSTSEMSGTVPESECPQAGPVAEMLYDGQVTALSFDAAGRLLVQSREPAQLAIVDVTDNRDFPGYLQLQIHSVIALDEQSMRDTGHDFFHSDVGGGLACASCHPEGRDDGHAWNFEGIGIRRTQNMSGGLKGSEPFHWNGDMQDFQHLVDEVMTSRMGGFPVEPRFAEALLGWIDKLPALTVPTTKIAAVERGRALFESSNCASCHSGPAFTNHASADVGTGGMLQVPSLLGLGLRGPYMHDGCAKDLVARFDPACGGGDRHGTTSQLSKGEVADLATYLSTL